MDDIFFSPIIEDLSEHSKMTASCKDTSSSLKPTDAAHSKCRWALSSTCVLLSCHAVSGITADVFPWGIPLLLAFSRLLAGQNRSVWTGDGKKRTFASLHSWTLIVLLHFLTLSCSPFTFSMQQTFLWSVLVFLVVLYKPAQFVSLINRFVYAISDWQREGEGTVLEFVLLTAISLCKELALLPSCQINQEFCPLLTGE